MGKKRSSGEERKDKRMSKREEKKQLKLNKEQEVMGDDSGL